MVAVAGTAIAGPLATKSVLDKKEKKQVKNIAKNQVNKLASGLSVAKATNADTVDGANASDLRTSSAFGENTTVIPSLGAAFVPVATATITTQAAGRILATGSAELFGANADERGQCRIAIDGTNSAAYEVAPDDIGANNEIVNAVNFAVTRGPGTYTASLDCRAAAGTVGKDDAAINVYGLGA